MSMNYLTLANGSDATIIDAALLNLLKEFHTVTYLGDVKLEEGSFGLYASKRHALQLFAIQFAVVKQENVIYAYDVQEWDGFFTGMENVKVIQYNGLSRSEWFGTITRIIQSPYTNTQFHVESNNGGWHQWVTHSDLYDGNPQRYATYIK